jgi:hypothetical protein
MRREYLGDSYDAVKRLWQDLLRETAPLQAEARFIPEDLREDYSRLTGIPILVDPLPRRYSILNDPDTGIRLPGENNQPEGRTHLSIESIKEQLRSRGVFCVITFDQSRYRNHRLSLPEQRRAKIKALEEAGFSAFYYVSHAPFLFSFGSIRAARKVAGILTRAGLPNEPHRFEGLPL